jgi:recombination associated protein RdgC
MFKNAQIYRLPANYDIDAGRLEDFLVKYQFASCNSAETSTQGWCPPLTGGLLVHSTQRQLLITYATEKKVIPPSYADKQCKLKAAEYEQQHGFKPGRKATKEIKDAVIDELLPKAFTVEQKTAIWIDPVNGWLVIDSVSDSRAGDIIRLLNKCIDKFPVQRFKTNRSAISSMTDWLAADEAPSGFTVDDHAELRAMNDGKATVKYVRHGLSNEDVRNHISAGKQCTSLALTWNDRLSFVLADGMVLKKITQTDLQKRKPGEPGKDAIEQLDADLLLMSSEMHNLLTNLANAMAGEDVTQGDWVQEAAKAGGAGKPQTTVVGVDGDELYSAALELVRAANDISPAMLQRHLRIGYNRAERLIEEMARRGAVTPPDAGGKRYLQNELALVD